MKPENEMERKREAYLLDPTAPPEESVAELERSLRPLRFDAERNELALPPRNRPLKRQWSRRVVAPLAVAAALLFVVLGLRAWIWSWPEGRPWKVVSPGVEQQYLGEGEQLRVGEDGANVRIARIGRMQVSPDTDVELVSTGGVRHQLKVEQGRVSVGVWAPPFSVLIHTPAGRIFDMGCAFDLTLGGETAMVEVTSGWVQLENRWGGVLVPEGAASDMTRLRRASVPVFTDASDTLRNAVRKIEAGEGSVADLEAIGSAARPRDVYSILMLAERTPFGRDTLLRNAARLAPPPSPRVAERASAGDRHALWEWARTLELPPPKSWVRNWRDAFAF